MKTSLRPASVRVSWWLETSSIKTPFPGRFSVPSFFFSLFIFYILSYLPSKTMGCFSGRLMSAASDQKLFCELCSAFNCSFDEFVGEKVVSPSYSSAILTPPTPTVSFLFLENASHIPFILHVLQFIIRSHTLWSLCDWFIVWLHSLFFLEGTYNSGMAISFFQSLFWRLFKVMHNVALLLRL